MHERYVLEGLFVEVTNKCHMYCRHCSSEASASNQEYIPPERLFQLIDEGIPLGLKNLSLSGGEPILYPELFSVLEYAKSLGLNVCIYSCGIMEEGNQLCPLTIEVINRLKILNLDKLIFSIHGACDRTHDYITRIKCSFALALESIKRAIDIGLTVELHFVPMQVNYKEIPDLVRLADSLGIKQVSLLRLVPQGRCKNEFDSLILNKDEASEIVKTVQHLRTKFNNIKIRLGAPFNCVNWGDITPCSASQNKLLISATGEVFPCEAFKWLKGERKTIYNYTLEHLWNEDELLNQLRSLRLEDVKVCSSCPMLSECRGGCPGQRMRFNKDISNGPEFWCSLYN